MLYGAIAILALATGLYLWLRRSNTIAPDVTPPKALRLWTAAFFITAALSHIWWYVLGIYWLTDDRLVRNIDRLFYMLRLQYDFERVKGIIFGTFNSIKYDLQYGSVEQMLVAHLHEYEIPVCCGFPVGSNSCIPLIEGAPCTLDVSIDKAMLSYNIKGNVEPYEVNFAKSNLIKEPDL